MKLSLAIAYGILLATTVILWQQNAINEEQCSAIAALQEALEEQKALVEISLGLHKVPDPNRGMEKKGLLAID